MSDTPLHSRRKRLEEYARREAAGENLWDPDFPAPVRVKIRHGARMAATPLGRDGFDEVMQRARSRILTDEGWDDLMNDREPSRDFLKLLSDGSNELIPTAVEALWWALGLRYTTPYGDPVGPPVRPLFDQHVNTAFVEHRVAWELVEGRMVEFESRELHQEVVVPTLQLLAGRNGWNGVEASYQKALKEISEDPADAITDAASALQETLTLLGCTGNSLGPLAKSAREKGLLAPHDSPLAEALKRIIDWASADRSEKGDAHPGPSPSPADAWFAVHTVGALILRLAHGPR